VANTAASLSTLPMLESATLSMPSSLKLTWSAPTTQTPTISSMVTGIPSGVGLVVAVGSGGTVGGKGVADGLDVSVGGMGEGSMLVVPEQDRRKTVSSAKNMAVLITFIVSIPMSKAFG
jgi:hypothetical protein